MKNKTLEFVKNVGIAGVPFIAGGVGGAELSDLVTDNETIISFVSTASQYLLAYPTFMAFHAYDNKDLYKKEGRWDKKRLSVDTLKIMFSLAAAEIAYVVGRTPLMNYFLTKDFSPAAASVIADVISTPLYFGIAIPLAKRTGIIRKEKPTEQP